MDAFIGEIRPFCFTYPPYGWMQCYGQQLNVSQFPALYSIIGNKFGGTQNVNFNLPNLQGLALVGAGQLTGGQNYIWGATGGATTETIAGNQMAAHTHAFNGAIGASLALDVANETQTAGAAGTSYVSTLVGTNGATKVTGRAYADVPVNTQMNAGMLNVVGGGQPHNNMAPYVAISYCICVTEGVYPVKD